MWRSCLSVHDSLHMGRLESTVLIFHYSIHSQKFTTMVLPIINIVLAAVALAIAILTWMAPTV